MSHHDGHHEENISHSVYGPIWDTIVQKVKKTMDDSKGPKPFMNSYVAGVLLGIILFLAFFIVGKGLGGSGAYARLHAYVMESLFPAYIEQAPYFKRYLTGTSHMLWDWLFIMAVGVAIGGAISGIRGKRMKAEVLKGPRISTTSRLILAFLGGILVAIGGRVAGGCTSGLALTGGALMGVAGWSFFISVFVSGFIAAYIVRKQWI